MAQLSLSRRANEDSDLASLVPSECYHYGQRQQPQVILCPTRRSSPGPQHFQDYSSCYIHTSRKKTKTQTSLPYKHKLARDQPSPSE
jgi:hypothetical protein